MTILSKFNLYTAFFALLALAPLASTEAQQLTNKQLQQLRKQFEEENKHQEIRADQVATMWEAQANAHPQYYEPIFKKYREAIQSILPKLYDNRNNNTDKNNRPRYGALNLNEMFDRFNEVKIFEDFNNQKPIQADPHRDTDFYLPKHKMAVLNKGFRFSDPEKKINILIHVFLGAAGYEDNDYQLTMALRKAELKISSPNDPTVSAIDISSLFPQNKKQLNWQPKPQAIPKRSVVDQQQFYVAGGRGGFTGSGGGGDSGAALVKKLLLEYTPEQIKYYTSKNKSSCHSAWSNHTFYIQDIQSLSIETNDNIPIIFAERRAVGSYYISQINSVYGGENKKAVLTAVNIFADHCEAKYGGK